MAVESGESRSEPGKLKRRRWVKVAKGLKVAKVGEFDSTRAYRGVPLASFYSMRSVYILHLLYYFTLEPFLI